MIQILFVLAVLAIIWSMVEIVSPQIVFRIYEKAGITFLTERQMLRLIRLDGLVSWIIFTLLGAYLYGKL